MSVTENPTNSKERIIEATLRIAAKKGFANTKTADIAKEAGVSEGLIYKYFPTKSELFTLIIQDNIRLIRGGVTAIIANRQMTATEKMKALIQFHIHFFTEERNLAQLIFGMSDRISLAPLPVLEFGFKPYSQLISQILAEGIERGEFRPVNTEIMCSVILGSLQLTLINLFFGDCQYGVGDVLQESTAYILAGLRADKKEQE